MHTAFDTNGPMGECLFPMNDNGDIEISEIITLENANANNLNIAIKRYIESYIFNNKIKKKQEALVENNIDYWLEFPVGEQEIGLEIWGSPVFAFTRDASKVTFRINVQIREGKYKYKLYDFWTQRRTIHGEGKNNGPSNMIHWQRVNSLSKERDVYAQSHDINKRSTKEVIYDYNAQIESENYQYSLEHDYIMDFVEGLKNVKASSDNDFDDFDEVSSNKANAEEPLDVEELDLSTFSGNLLQKGNNVFVVAASLKPYVMAGVAELKKQISIDGFWNIVNYPEQAHFILEYNVDTEGRDKAYLKLFKHDRRLGYTSGWLHTSESAADNREIAKRLYMKELVSIMNTLDKGKKTKEIEAFEF